MCVIYTAYKHLEKENPQYTRVLRKEFYGRQGNNQGALCGS